MTGLSLISFADADYASRSTDRRSVSGRVVMCAGGPVSWHSKTHKCVTLSTTQAEYAAMSDMGKEICFRGRSGVLCCRRLGCRAMPCMRITRVPFSNRKPPDF